MFRRFRAGAAIQTRSREQLARVEGILSGADETVPERTDKFGLPLSLSGDHVHAILIVLFATILAAILGFWAGQG